MLSSLINQWARCDENGVRTDLFLSATNMLVPPYIANIQTRLQSNIVNTNDRW